MRLRVPLSFLLLAVLFVGMLGSTRSVLGDSASASTASGAANFREDFNGSMDPAWAWVRQDPANWSLSQQPGYLSIRTKAGTLDATSTADNILLRATPSEPYVLQAAFQFQALDGNQNYQNYHEGALLVYMDDDNYIKFSRLYSTATPNPGNKLLFRWEKNGVPQGAISVRYPDRAVEVRIIVEESAVSGAYKTAEGEWIMIGSFQVNGLTEFNQVGLTAFHGNIMPAPEPIWVHFDYVEIYAVPNQIYLPLVAR
jgi:hypothetical protein